jgi:benzoyl-CoA reductase/2-hydroxyglutaryl-CoA dehydratase subunit BcrC/BadD/HgdB
VFIKKALNERNIPNIHLERDFNGKADEQMKNRLEAFRELI